MAAVERALVVGGGIGGLGAATALAQRGIGKTGPNALHVGDQIKIKFLPAKDGSPLGFLKTVTMPDGRVIIVSGGGPNE